MSVLTVWSPLDGLFAAIAPLGLAAAAGTALVVDLDPGGPAYPGDVTLAGLVRRGPRRSDLVPSRAGVAVVGNGGIDLDEAAEVLAALRSGWPAVVLRACPVDIPPDLAPVVPVIPLLPGALRIETDGPAVWQRTGFAASPPGPGPVLPPPAGRVVEAMLNGVVDARWRWVRSWQQVWRLPWT